MVMITTGITTSSVKDISNINVPVGCNPRSLPVGREGEWIDITPALLIKISVSEAPNSKS